MGLYEVYSHPEIRRIGTKLRKIAEKEPCRPPMVQITREMYEEAKLDPSEVKMEALRFLIASDLTMPKGPESFERIERSKTWLELIKTLDGLGIGIEEDITHFDLDLTKNAIISIACSCPTPCEEK